MNVGMLHVATAQAFRPTKRSPRFKKTPTTSGESFRFNTAQKQCDYYLRAFAPFATLGDAAFDAFCFSGVGFFAADLAAGAASSSPPHPMMAVLNDRSPASAIFMNILKSPNIHDGFCLVRLTGLLLHQEGRILYEER
jgi:hypothetical protein